MHDFLTRLISLCLLKILCDMLLPDGGGSRYADLGISLMLLIHALTQIHALWKGGWT